MSRSAELLVPSRSVLMVAGIPSPAKQHVLACVDRCQTVFLADQPATSEQDVDTDRLVLDVDRCVRRGRNVVIDETAADPVVVERTVAACDRHGVELHVMLVVVENSETPVEDPTLRSSWRTVSENPADWYADATSVATLTAASAREIRRVLFR